MKVHGVVVIDLARRNLDGPDAASTARGLIWSGLVEAPAGVDVRLVVPGWSWWSPFAAEEVRDHGEHLGNVTVEGDAETVRRWVLALRYGVTANDFTSGW